MGVENVLDNFCQLDVEALFVIATEKSFPCRSKVGDVTFVVGLDKVNSAVPVICEVFASWSVE
jgi:hypothetical protein